MARRRPAGQHHAFKAAHDDYSDILLKSLADRFAEAFAERLHKHVRTDLWGYAPDEQLTNDALIKEEYRGIRPAPGYPACPDHSLKPLLFDMLDAEGNPQNQWRWEPNDELLASAKSVISEALARVKAKPELKDR